jgi:hypothetical protein
MKGLMTKIVSDEQKKPGRGEKVSSAGKRAAKKLASEPAGPASGGRSVGVVIEYNDEMASEIYVAGSFNNWDPRGFRLAKQKNGKWTATLNLGPGRYEYRLVVDGQWQEDGGASKFAANPFGGFNSIIEVELA